MPETQITQMLANICPNRQGGCYTSLHREFREIGLRILNKNKLKIPRYLCQNLAGDNVKQA